MKLKIGVLLLVVGITISGCQPGSVVEATKTATGASTQNQITTKLVTTAAPTQPLTTVTSATKPPATAAQVTQAPTTTSAADAEQEWFTKMNVVLKDKFASEATIESSKIEKEFLIIPDNTNDITEIVMRFDIDIAMGDEWVRIRDSVVDVSTDITTSLPDYSIIYLNPLDKERMLLKVINGEIAYDFSQDKVVVNDSVKTFSDGTFIVNDEIESGIYRVLPSNEYSAEIARLKDTDMDSDSIIEDGFFSGPGYVQIKSTDEAVQISDATIWKVDVKSMPKNPKTELTPGIYLVGIDIAPGSYKVMPLDGSEAYIERLSGLDMSYDRVINGNFFSGTGYVTVKKSDFAISIEDGTLSKRD